MSQVTIRRNAATPYTVECLNPYDSGDSGDFATKAEAVAYIQAQMDQGGWVDDYRIVCPVTFRINIPD